MRAATRHRYGPPEVIRIEQLDVPAPRAGELLVRVHAATVSRTDCALLTAEPFIMRFVTGFRRPNRATLGTDFAGRVEAVGAGVSRFAPGDDVWGIDDTGAQSHAEYLRVPASAAVAPMPAGPSHAEAAACLEGAWYAYSALERAGFRRSSKVLINGATGAIGSALLQLAVDRGARVTAVGDAKNASLLSSLGAERVLDYERTDFTRDPGEYDYVFDAVGKSTFGACKPLLGPKGVYVSTELGPGWQNPWLALLTPALGGPRVVFPIPIERERFLAAIGSLVLQRRFRPIIDRAYTLDAVREAYTYVASGRKTGSVILNLAEP